MIITILIIIYYFIKQNDYYQEIEKIKRLEALKKKKNIRLKRLRTHTKPCGTYYKDPKSCFFNSGFSCSWNELTDRCEKK
jgi:hypothetical protein